jgi:formate-dependent nitrite reductase membrane component NrfD
VVCPTHAILAGDLDDPSSEIARAVAKNSVVVRKPEQGTAPKLFYIEGNAVSLHPTAFEREPAGLAFADVVDLHGEAVRPAYTDEIRFPVRVHLGGNDEPVRRSDSGTPIRTPGAQGEPTGGPIHVGEGRLAGQMAQVAWNAQHKIPWHWPVPAYLVTKGIGAGAFLALGGVVLGGGELTHVAASVVSGLGLLALLATTVFLVIDLERPTRFLRIVFRPQAKSWLARGAFLLIGFSLVATAWFVLELGAAFGIVPSAFASAARMPLSVAALPLAIGAAVYTAFLFAQCEGRDLWQSPLLPFHLLVQAGMVGGASLALVGPIVDLGSLALVWRPLFAGAMLLDLFLLGVGEFTVPHASEVAAKAAHAITRGRYGKQFWGGAVVVGHLAPLALLVFGVPVLAALAGILAIGGLFAYEHAFVMAPQEIPNS